MLRRWLALTYYLYALRLTALHHFYFNPLYYILRSLGRWPASAQAKERPPESLQVVFVCIAQGGLPVQLKFAFDVVHQIFGFFFGFGGQVFGSFLTFF